MHGIGGNPHHIAGSDGDFLSVNTDKPLTLEKEIDFFLGVLMVFHLTGMIQISPGVVKGRFQTGGKNGACEDGILVGFFTETGIKGGFDFHGRISFVFVL